MRHIGLDVHRDFCEVAIAEAGELRSAGRIETTPEAIELFGESLGRDDRVALEVTGNAGDHADRRTARRAGALARERAAKQLRSGLLSSRSSVPMAR